MSMKAIPLQALHQSLGAKFGAFAGFNMPIQYPDGLKAEHLHTRLAAGLFDVSHMGQLDVTAKDGTLASLMKGLEAALPIDFDGWPVGLQKYSYLLNSEGGIEDDLMLTLCDGYVRMVVNAGNRDTDLALLERLAPNLNFSWVDAALLALQGPLSEQVLTYLDPNVSNLRFMQAADLRLEGANCFTSRSGYTGEDGFEISVPSSAAHAVASRILANPLVKPIGLGARDTLRLEAGLPLHGHDITAQTTPIQAGLAFAIPKSRRSGGVKAGGFPGAVRLESQWANDPAPERKLISLFSDESIPIRGHTQLVLQDQTVVGEITSGTVSPTLGKPIMLAYVDTAVAQAIKDGLCLHAVVRDKRPIVKFAALPFVAKRYKR